MLWFSLLPHRIVYVNKKKRNKNIERSTSMLKTEELYWREKISNSTMPLTVTLNKINYRHRPTAVGLCRPYPTVQSDLHWPIHCSGFSYLFTASSNDQMDPSFNCDVSRKITCNPVNVLGVCVKHFSTILIDSHSEPLRNIELPPGGGKGRIAHQTFYILTQSSHDIPSKLRRKSIQTPKVFA